MQTEGARRLSVATGAHRIIGRRWSPGLLVTDFRFYLASRRQVLTRTFCDDRRYLNFRHFLTFRYAIIPKDDAIIPKDDVTIPNCATIISNLSRLEKQFYRFLRVPVKVRLKLSSKVWHRCPGCLWAYTLERVINKMAPQGPRAPQGPYSEQSLRAVLVGLLGFDRI